MATKKVGRPKSIQSPELMWQYFIDYCHENSKTRYGIPTGINFKTGETLLQQKRKPLTWVGFEKWMHKEGIISNLNDYEANRDGLYEEFSTTIKKIKSWIYEDKFVGAAMDEFNASFIGKAILVDKQQHDVNDVSPPRELKVTIVESKQKPKKN